VVFTRAGRRERLFPLQEVARALLQPTASPGGSSLRSRRAAPWPPQPDDHRETRRGADAGDKWRSIACEKPEHLGERLRKHGAILGSAQPLRGEDERSDARLQQSVKLDITVPDTLVFGDNDPAVLACGLEPCLVRGIFGEVVGVDLDSGAGATESLGDGVAPQVAIDEEDGSGPLTRRRGVPSRSGSPLESR
jgi:hypothetical protein